MVKVLSNRTIILRRRHLDLSWQSDFDCAAYHLQFDISTY